VENECTSHIFGSFPIFLKKIIEIGGNLTKFWQKQICLVFFGTRCSWKGRHFVTVYKQSDWLDSSLQVRLSWLRKITSTWQLIRLCLYVSEKVHPFYFLYNFPNCKSIQIICGRDIADINWNKLIHGNFDILFIVHC